MPEKEPLHKVAQSWATTASIILIPLAVAWMANSYQNEMSQQKLNSEYVSLAINILREEPTPKNRALRYWAIETIDHYSEVKFSSHAKESLAKEIKFADINERVLQRAKDFLGTPYGFGSHDELTTSEFTDKVYREYNITRNK